jgi:hypothetical protein
MLKSNSGVNVLNWDITKRVLYFVGGTFDDLPKRKGVVLCTIPFLLGKLNFRYIQRIDCWGDRKQSLRVKKSL